MDSNGIAVELRDLNTRVLRSDDPKLRRKIFRTVSGLSSDDSGYLDPYITFVIQRLRDASDAWPAHSYASIEFFTLLVRYFSQRPDNQIADFLGDSSTDLERILGPVYGNVDHRKHQASAAIKCFALWTMIEELMDKFRDEEEQRKCAKALGIVQDAILFGHFSIQELMGSAGLIPEKVPEEPNPYEEIPCRKLNASVLVDIGRVELEWTNDLSRHLWLENGVLCVFSMPCKLQAPGSGEHDPQEALMSMGLPDEYTKEIRRSYGLLFSTTKSQRLLQRILRNNENGASGSNTNYRDNDNDDEAVIVDSRRIKQLSQSIEFNAWQKSYFRHLWPRIAMMKNYLDRAEPGSFWEVLWRDRRNKATWWGFVIAFAVLGLTLIQTVASIVQAVKAF